MHLFGRAQIKLLGRVPHPLLVGHQRLRLQTDQAVVRFPVLAFDVMHVVGRHQRQIEFLRPFDEHAIDLPLVFDPVIVEFDVIIARRENVAVLVQRGLRLIELVVFDLVRHLALETGREPDQSLRVLREDFLVDARLVVKPFEMRRRDELDQVLVADLVLGQQHQMIRRVPRVAGFLVQPAARRDVRLASDDRFDAAFRRRLVEIDRAVHVAVIGDRDRRHLRRVRLLHHVINAARPIEQAVLGVQMQMDEIRMLHALAAATLEAATETIKTFAEQRPNLNRESQCFRADGIGDYSWPTRRRAHVRFCWGAEQSGATILVAVFEQPDGPRKGRCSERKLEACATLLFKPAVART